MEIILTILASDTAIHTFWGWLYFSIVGLVVGSFLNVCIDRLPLQYLQRVKKDIISETSYSDFLKQQIESNHLNLLTPIRSFCFYCGYQLSWYENLPVFSYLWLKGECSQCQNKIGQRALWIEILNAMIYGFLFLLNGWAVSSLLIGAHFSYGIVISIILKENRWLPPLLLHLSMLIIIIDVGLIFYILL